MPEPRILVVGDVMQDAYHIGTTRRVAMEAPIPIVDITDTKYFPGGAANVAQNLEALGAEVMLAFGHGLTAMHTPIKNRLMVGDKILARWDENDRVKPVDYNVIDSKVHIWRPDAVIVSDYGKGSINQDVIQWVADYTDRHNVPVFCDTKQDPDKFPMIWTFFPNQTEFQQYERQYLRTASVVYKKAEKGIQHLSFGRILEQYPAWASKVVSVTGAGDTVIAAYTYASITNRWNALVFANTAAAVVVEKSWTATATIEEIVKHGEDSACYYERLREVEL